MAGMGVIRFALVEALWGATYFRGRCRGAQVRLLPDRWSYNPRWLSWGVMTIPPGDSGLLALDLRLAATGRQT